MKGGHPSYCVLLEMDKGEDTPSGAVDATDDVISGIAKYIENCGCIEGQEASLFDLTPYRTGLIKGENLKVMEGVNSNKVIAIHSMAFVIVTIQPQIYADYR